jgi:hypothetical protein
MFACEAKIKVVTAHNYISGIPYVPLGCAPRRSGSGGAGGWVHAVFLNARTVRLIRRAFASALRASLATECR